jgi:hypothetical protein
MIDCCWQQCGGCFVPEILHLKTQVMLHLNAGRSGGCFVPEILPVQLQYTLPECWQLWQLLCS